MDLTQALQMTFMRFLEPITAAAANPLYRRDLLAALGLDLVSAAEEAVADLADALGACAEVVQALADVDVADPSLEDLLRVLEGVADAVTAARAVAEQAAALDPETFDPLDLLQRLLSLLTVRYLLAYVPTAYAAARLLTLIRVPENQYPPFPQVVLDDVPALVSDPANFLTSYYLGDGGLAALQTTEDARQAADRLFPRVAALLQRLGINALYARDPGRDLPLETTIADRLLTLQFPIAPGAGAGLAITLRAEEEEGAAFVFLPFGALGYTHTTPDWSVTLTVTGMLNGLAIGTQGLELPDGQEDLTLQAQLTASKRARGTAPALRTSASGTRLEIGAAQVMIGATFGADYDVELLLELKSAALVVAPPAGDGFLQQILPADGVRANFDLAIGWSRRRGLHFRGGAGLEATLPVQANLLGVLAVDSVYVALKTGDNDLRGVLASTVTVTLGPLTAVVERMGLEARLSFPPEGGNLGLADLAVAFMPPRGAALAIDAAVVRGGGYLFFEPDRQQYAGILMLEIGGVVTVTAIGLLTTRLPDGSAGFSLFVLITAEDFAPIQLGMGFTLDGLGGLLGLHRTVMADVLRDGLQRNTLDHLLFPRDPLRKAPAIIAGLNAAFPPAPDRFLFGPMAVLGWGTPTLVTLKLALVLEIPDPVRLMILGRLTATLPDPEHPLVHIQIDAIGELNFQQGTVALDGTLVDSKLLEFVLTGSMRLRASWGESPYFMLSLGGFHPRFPVPAGMAGLTRLGLSLSASDSLRLRLETYLALTPNTVQFGARVDLLVKAGDFSLEGCLAFDTLLNLAPFGFVVDIAAGVALRHKGSLLLGVFLTMSLSGPTPWHVRGTASFELFLLHFTVQFDHRFGPAAPPPLPEPVDVGTLLRAALADVRSWSSELPGDTHPFVALRAVPGSGVVAHPLARVTVRQRIVPFDYRIARFGSAVPAGEREFHVRVELAGGSLAVQPQMLEDHFAPGQFQNLREDEKLFGSSFEKRQAGFQFGSDAYAYDAALSLEMPIDHETIVVEVSGQP